MLIDYDSVQRCGSLCYLRDKLRVFLTASKVINEVVVVFCPQGVKTGKDLPRVDGAYVLRA